MEQIFGFVVVFAMIGGPLLVGLAFVYLIVGAIVNLFATDFLWSRDYGTDDPREGDTGPETWLFRLAAWIGVPMVIIGTYAHWDVVIAVGGFFIAVYAFKRFVF